MELLCESFLRKSFAHYDLDLLVYTIMLARAAARTLTFQAKPVYIQAVISPCQPRPYSKNIKPREPFEYKPPNAASASPHGPNTPRSSKLAASVPAGNNSSSNTSSPGIDQAVKDVTQFQEKLKIIDEQIKDLGPNSPFKTRKASDYSLLQDELYSSASSSSNTAPQSTAPSAINPAVSQAQDAAAPSPKPMPDLTQGIPSTLDAQLAGQEKSDPASLNITEDPSAGRSKGGGDLPKTAYISSLERKRTRIARWIYGIVLFNIAASTVWFGRNWENEEEECRHPNAPSGWGFGLFYKRMKARWRDTLDYYNEPAFPKLLPDQDPAWARPYTLILSLEDLLVHSEWSREHGWRMAKRPGVDYFLRYLSQYYELVIWTSAQSMIAQPIIQKLDPYRVVMWPLFREATRYQKGEYIKVGL